MRPVTAILLVVALLIAGAAAFLVKGMLSGGGDGGDGREKAVMATKEILIAARDIPVGKIINSGDLDWLAWPAEMVNERFIEKGTNKDATVNFIGSIARTAFVAGEPIAAKRLFNQGDAGFLAGMLSPGMRAVGIAVKPEHDAGGFLLPGDRADVILSYEFKTRANSMLTEPSQGKVYRRAAQTIVRNARVLGIDQTMIREDNQGVKVKTVTIEVTPEEAERVTLGSIMGTLFLTLRSLAPGPGEDEAYPVTTNDFEMGEGLRASLTGIPADGVPFDAQAETAFDPMPPSPPPQTARPVTPRPQAAPRRPSASSVRVYRGGAQSTETFGR